MKMKAHTTFCFWQEMSTNFICNLFNLFIVSLLFFLWSTHAYAAITPLELREIQKQQEQIIQQLDERMKMQEQQLQQDFVTPFPSELLPAVPSTPFAPCIDVTDILIENMSIFPARDFEKYIAPIRGQCITLADINNLLRDISNRYIEKGYITSRAFVATEQANQDKGILNIFILEGKIEDIILNEGDPNYVMRGKTAFPGLIGNFLNLRDIEQGLDQLNRLPSQNFFMEFVPGKEVGGTIVKVTSSPEKTWRLNFSTDNYGQESTGTNLYNISFTKDNFFGMNDQLAFFWTENFLNGTEKTFHNKSTTGNNRSFDINTSFPFGWWTLSGRISHFNYASPLYGTNKTYIMSGNSEVYSLDLERVIHRNAQGKTSLILNLNSRNVNTYIEDTHLKGSSYQLMTAGLTLSHTRRWLNGVLSGSLSYTRGLNLFGIQLSTETSSPQTIFNKFFAYLNWYRPFIINEQNFYFTSSLNAQYSQDTLYSPERIQIGGRGTVRGFHSESLSGDSGIYIRNELGWNLPWFKKLEQKSFLTGMQVFISYDAGLIYKDSHDPYERGRLSGIGIGLRSLGDLNIQIAASKPLSSPQFIKKTGTVFYASISYTF